MHGLPFKEIIVFLTVAGVFIPFLARLRLNPVLGFLLAGMLIGPYGLVHLPAAPEIFSEIAFTDIEQTMFLGELGIVFLLFLIGIELSPARLFAMRRLIFGLGAAQVLVCGAVIGLIAWAWGNSASSSVILGLCLALSSTAVVMKIIMDRRHFSSSMGQTSFSILLFQDLAIVPLMFLVALMSDKTPGADKGLSLLIALAKAGGVIVLVLGMVHFVARPVLRMASSSGNPEYFMACVLLVLLLSAMTTEHAGLSMALGAFLAGLAFAETEFRNQIEIDLEPFKGLFMGLFFISVGMSIDVAMITQHIFWLFVGVAGLFCIKAALIAGLCLAFGIPAPIAVRTGISLSQAGEFAFIIIGIAAPAGIIPETTAQFMVMLTTLTLVLTPGAYWLGEKCEGFLLKRSVLSHEDVLSESRKDISGHVVIAGFGRTGQAVAKILEENQIAYLALDVDGSNLDPLRRKGMPVFLGDAGNIQALQKVYADRARSIVLAIDDKRPTKAMIRNIRKFCPHATIYARARDEKHAKELKEQGVNALVLEIEGVSQYLAQRVLEGMN